MTPREFMARYVADDPDFLGSALARYCDAEELSDEELAARLRCSVERLVQLRLCLRPRLERFWADVQEIATAVGADPDELAKIVRHADALASIPQDGGRMNLLIAARDREPDEATKPAAEDDDP